MTLPSPLRVALKRVADSIQSSIPGYRFLRHEDFEPTGPLEKRIEKTDREFCSTCGSPISTGTEGDFSSSHNAITCRLVNLALTEMGVSFDQMIRVMIYPNNGPLKGYYSPFEPFTIHVAEEAYFLYPEYIIFHETKHLVDCLMKGWSEEDTPDPFARDLCARYGFRCPPPSPSANPVVFSPPLMY
jgi:hypothetical protein